jgi:amidohydrolase
VSRPPLSELLAPHAEALTAFRRDLHCHPELGFQESRTTARVAQRLEQAGLRPQLLPGTGLTCDIGDQHEPTVALRGDLDALPLPEEQWAPWASSVPGVSHACGHDLHTTAVLGAGLLLADLDRAGLLRGRVRLIFQPAEELMPGGALAVIAHGVLDGVDRVYALHCDPRTDVGQVGSRVGAITAASDLLRVRLHGAGGHTSRPHLTQDVVFALAQVVTQVSAVLSRRLDPRAGAAMVWGRIGAGSAANAIPAEGEVVGTFRCLDSAVWGQAGAILTETVQDVVRPYGVTADIEHTRGVPPTVNDADAVAVAEAAARDELGENAVLLSPQSLGGEDFGWILEKVPGAMLRLGTRTPGGATYDLHRPDFRLDEGALGVGIRLLTAIALRDLDTRSRTPVTS